VSGPNAVLEASRVAKYYESIVALNDVSFAAYQSQVSCLLGDNGAGKSTLIKLLSGVEQPDAGVISVESAEVAMRGPRDALALGVATVYQDLALVPLMSVYRNFWLGREPMRGKLVTRRIDKKEACRIAQEQLHEIGVDIDDLERPINELSGGQRQCVAIAKAAYFGAKVLILDEPTASLGVRQAALVLRYTLAARDRGLAVVFITHNVHHALAIGDHFTVLSLGQVAAKFERGEKSVQEVELLMAGGRQGIELIDDVIGERSTDVTSQPGADAINKGSTGEVSERSTDAT
jgi:simple sugar transport system ATP-binding protein